MCKTFKFLKHLMFTVLMLSALVNVLSSTSAFAQGNTYTVSGTVSDETGPVIGATVMVSGSKNGVITDTDGRYTIGGVMLNDILNISCLGYTTSEVAFTGQTTIDVMLKTSSEFIDATVVTALGIKRSEKALSYNVQAVDGSALTAVKDVNFVNSLNGKVAGVTINSGASGSGSASISSTVTPSAFAKGDNNVTSG